MSEVMAAPTDAPAPRMQLQPVSDDSEFAVLLDSNRFAQIQRVAKLFSECDLVPDTFRGKPANCAVALQMAFRMKVDPMALMQNIHVVHGKPGLDGKMAIALINQRGPFTGPIQWRFEGAGETRKCTAFAKHKVTGETLELAIDWSTVKGEGWDKNAKWKTMMDQMFRYRTAAWFGRAYCPEVLMGLPTADEIEDVNFTPKTVQGERIVDREAELMPRSTGQTAVASDHVVVAESTRTEPAVDLETGEIIGDPAPAQQQQDLAGDPMAGPKSTDAQKLMLGNIAKKNGVDYKTMAAAIAEKYALAIDDIPASWVNEISGFVRALKA